MYIKDIRNGVITLRDGSQIKGDLIVAADGERVGCPSSLSDSAKISLSVCHQGCLW